MIQIVVRIKNSIQKTKIKDVIPNLGGAYLFSKIIKLYLRIRMELFKKKV